MEVDAEDASNEQDVESNDSDNEEELEAMAETLENEIAGNIFSYQSHIDLISVLKQLADLDRLRLARERMAKQFPLTSELWLDWLEDEIKIASTPEEKANVLNIFKRAVKDYLSIEIWSKYVEFAMDIYDTGKESDIAEVRKVCECALTAGALHVTKGSLLWSAYIDFEKKILGTLQKTSDAYLNQLKLVANLYKRCLSCPLADIEEHFNEFATWLDEESKNCESFVVDKKMVESIYEKSKEKLSKIKIYEDALISDSEHANDHYRSYLEHEKSKAGSPVRVQFVYERMICDFCLHEDAWLDYVNYVGSVLNDRDRVMDVIGRSIRNCPWSSRLYRTFMRFLEKFGSSHESIREAFEQAVASGLQSTEDFREVWMSYLEYLRRRFDEPGISKEEEERRLEELRANFGKACDFLGQLEDSDPRFVVAQFWARIEAIYCKNMEKCRLLWNDVLSEESNRTCDMWLEYIHIERAFGDSKHLRKLYQRALQNVSEDAEKIAESWLNYERDEGTLESFEACTEKIRARLDQIRARREREEEARRREEREKGQETRRFKKPAPVAKAGRNHAPKTEDQFEGEGGGRRASGQKRKINREEEEMEAEEEEESPKKRSKKEENEELVKRLLEETRKDHGVTVVHDSTKDNRTVFVSNLDFSTEESVVREAFVPCGKITDLRLVKDYKGRSKGYCYVEFEKSSEAAAALKKDRETINGRPMFVSKCDPDRETREKGFKYSCNMEKNKLFVRGLPYSTTENDLRELFGKYGPLKDVRLVTYRNGHSKGLAYVDFEDEVSAAQAIIKTDGTMLGDREISVAISNPPDRRAEAAAKAKPAPAVSSLGGGPKETGPRGRGRTQISFVPRAVQRTRPSSAADSMANLSIVSPQPQSDETKKLSNSDFRNLIN